jgi:type IV pilus assembly protein PilM
MVMNSGIGISRYFNDPFYKGGSWMAIRLRKRIYPIGIQFYDSAIRIAKVSKSGSGWDFPIMEEIPLPQDTIQNGRVQDMERLVEEIQTRIPSNRFLPKKVVIGIPGHLVILRQVKMPRISKKSMRSALAVELQTNIHLPFEDPVFDFVMVEEPISDAAKQENPDEVSVVVVAAPGEVVRSYIEVVRTANLLPVAVDLALTAKERFAQLYFEDVMMKNEPYMLIHVTEESVEMGIFSKGVLYFSRTVNLSIHDYRAQVGNANSIRMFANDLAFEVERAINFYQYTLNGSDESCHYVLVISELSDNQDLLNVLRERIEPTVIGFEEQLANLYDMPMLTVRHIAAVSSKFAAAIGLSLKEVGR